MGAACSQHYANATARLFTLSTHMQVVTSGESPGQYSSQRVFSINYFIIN